jgi:LysR family hydrogen peroxide-inducible transcriptional activator
MNALPSPRQLGYLVEVADKLSFRAAAEASFVTQSTLSAGVKELESMLGVELVERDPKGVRLTPVGAEVVRRARTILAAAQDLVNTARMPARRSRASSVSALFRRSRLFCCPASCPRSGTSTRTSSSTFAKISPKGCWRSCARAISMPR